MTKNVQRLLAAVLTLILAFVMIVTITYAWTTVSTTPVAEGIQITIGGGHTILIAPDIAKTVDGTTYHYPGYFANTINFSQFQQYGYLNNLAPLAPVSTSDGINWFIADYYDSTDKEVINGTASVGEIKPIQSFIRDEYLDFANLPKDSKSQGHYVYIDFWVVSPGSDYTLRVSCGDDVGSYLLELKDAKKENGKYTLSDSLGSAAASARVGFLVNEDRVIDNSMLYYQQSHGYSEQYTKLLGNYNEQGKGFIGITNRFTIYEPNGDYHPESENGIYNITKPLGYSAGEVYLADIKDNLTVQLNNSWKTKADEGIVIEEMFQTAIAGKDVSSTQEAENILYKSYLQGQFAPYVNIGEFIQSTNALYDSCGSDETVSAQELKILNKSGATDDTYLTVLTKNVPQRIRMFIWLEGQDIDCTNSINGLDFALSIELAGSNQDIYE